MTRMIDHADATDFLARIRTGTVSIRPEPPHLDAGMAEEAATLIGRGLLSARRLVRALDARSCVPGAVTIDSLDETFADHGLPQSGL